MTPPSLLTPAHLRECHDCGSIQRLPEMPPDARAACPRCDAVLRHTRADPFTVPLALNVTALILFAVGSLFTLMSVNTAGQFRDASLVTGPEQLVGFGFWELSVVVLATTMLAPLARIACMIVVLGGLRLRYRPRGVRALFAWVEYLRPWSMVEIFLLGLFVAFVRLSSLVHLDPGPAVLALAAFTIVVVAADLLLDPVAVWEALDAQKPRRPETPRRMTTGTGKPIRIGCDTCGLVTRGMEGTPCPRCSFTLHHRKPGGLAVPWALVIAAAVLYVPANLYPFLTVVRFGAGEPSTILNGVRELLEAGMWPLALLVFFASVAVPVLKLVGLSVLLIATKRKGARRDLTILYRIVDSVGRWSMIDVFMESILVALVRFGTVVTISPGPGALAFSAVVILTIFASRAFDPRLLWDALATEETMPEPWSKAPPPPDIRTETSPA